MDQYALKNKKINFFFVPFTSLPEASKDYNSNVTIFLIVLNLIKSLYIKENFMGPGYLAFRAQTEFKKTYKINHFKKYDIKFDQKIIDIFKNEVTNHLKNIEYNLEYELKQTTKDSP